MNSKKFAGMILLIIGTAIPAQTLAIYDKYLPTIDPSEVSSPSFLTRLKADKNGIINIDDISIKLDNDREVNGDPQPTYYFSYKDKLIFALGGYPLLFDIWAADLDGNGFKDFAIDASWSGNCGTPNSVIILFQTSAGIFRRLDFDTFSNAQQSFKDIDHDGKPELLICTSYSPEGTIGPDECYYVDTAYKISNYSLSQMEYGKNRYPRFVWAIPTRFQTENTKISAREKREYYSSLRKNYLSSIDCAIHYDQESSS